MDMYLTEDKLFKFLKIAYNNEIIIRNCQVPNSGSKSRPDFRIESLKLLIEFDGYYHYNSSKRILNDIKNEQIYENLGYKIIRIPYFVQLSSIVVKELFGLDMEINQIYSHGFIDKKALLPADFCTLGILRFKNDLIKFDYIKSDIIESLKNQIKEKSIKEVLWDLDIIEFNEEL